MKARTQSLRTAAPSGAQTKSGIVRGKGGGCTRETWSQRVKEINRTMVKEKAMKSKIKN